MKKEKKITVSLSYRDWECILSQLKKTSLQYKRITSQVSIPAKKAAQKTKLTKKDISLNTGQDKLTPAAEKFRYHLISNMTLYEKIALQGLKELKIKYVLQKIFFYGDSFYIVDFYLPDYKIAIEIDGKQHHEVEGLNNDIIRTTALLSLGVKSVVRIPNSKCTSLYVKSVIREEIDSIVDYEIDKV